MALRSGDDAAWIRPDGSGDVSAPLPELNRRANEYTRVESVLLILESLSWKARFEESQTNV